MAYFPNGSSSDILDQQCADCPLGYGWNDPDQKHLFDSEREARSCPVILVQLTYNYAQCANKPLRDAMRLLINDDGICRVRHELVAARKDT